MAGVTPLDGENLILETIYNTNDLTIGLFTNSSGLGESSSLADIDAETGGDYVAITLTAASWTVSAGQATHPSVDFVCTSANYDLPVYGYYIATTVGTPTLLHFEVNSLAPVTVIVGDTYRVDLTNIVD